MGRGEISHCLGAKAAAIRFANDQENAPETRVRQSNLAISGMTPRVRTFTTRTIVRIRDRSMMLFPFLTPGLALERFGQHPQRGPTAATPKWQSPARVSDRPKPAAPPLAVSGAEIQDPRLWTELGIAADHVIFIAFIKPLRHRASVDPRVNRAAVPARQAR